MTLLILAAAVMTVCALVLLLPAFVNNQRSSGQARSLSQVELNQQVALQRYQELKEALKLGTIEQAEFDAQALELKASLADAAVVGEAGAIQKPVASTTSRWALLPAILLMLALPPLFYFSQGSAEHVTHWQGAQQRLPEFFNRAVLQQGEPLSADEMRDFALALRTNIERQPADVAIWNLLGRVAMANNDYQLALDALERAHSMEPENASIAVEYAQLLLSAADPGLKQQGRQLVLSSLQREPNNPNVLSAAAFLAYEAEDFGMARKLWQRLMTTLPEGDPRIVTIQRTLSMLPDTEAVDPTTEELVTEPQQPMTELEITVKLDASLKSELPQQGFLVVFARAVGGPPMPLAVKRMPISSFPQALLLSDADAMMPEMKLSAFEQVYLTARISSDADVTAQSGDLQGVGQPINVSVGKTAVSLLIDSKI